MIKNLTPHPINIIGKYGELTTIEPELTPARLSESKTVIIGYSDNIPITSTEFGEVENLPKEVKGTLLIVSQMVKGALPFRRDLVIPKQVIRDDNNNIIGCTSLSISK